MVSNIEQKIDVNLGRSFLVEATTTKTTLWLVRLQESMIIWLGQFKRKEKFDLDYFMAISIKIKLTSEVISCHVNFKKQKKKPLNEVTFSGFRYWVVNSFNLKTDRNLRGSVSSQR